MHKTLRVRSGGARGGLEGATAPLSEASSPLVEGNFWFLSEEIWQNDVLSHFSPLVESSSPSVGRFLVPPLRLWICVAYMNGYLAQNSLSKGSFNAKFSCDKRSFG